MAAADGIGEGQAAHERRGDVVRVSFHFDGHVKQRLALQGVSVQGVGSEQAPDDGRRAAAQATCQGDVHVQEQLQPRRLAAHLGKHGTGGLEHQVLVAGRQVDTVGQHGAPARLRRQRQRKRVVDLQREPQDVETATKIGRRSRNADAHLPARGLPHHVSSFGWSVCFPHFAAREAYRTHGW